ncbi:DUF3237 domain-containing protein [Pseudomonas sp. LRF_L74]|uniref:DUF3237 domain-containing protein n=1 Tax=Pseudomonas sp. LRF_L74 TaxID=3369422 RepID=UPI003F5EE2A7
MLRGVRDLQGCVLAGGADFFLLRPDGVGELDASYSLLTDRGERINIRNRGVLVMSEEGNQLEAQGIWPIAEEHYRCTCSPCFQVPAGRLDWMVPTTFIGLVQYPAADEVVVRCYRVM